MRNTTKAIAALTAIAATMAFGVSQASALTWSQTTGANLQGSITLTNGTTGVTASCPNVQMGIGLSNVSGQAKWEIPGDYFNSCSYQGPHGTVPSQWPVGSWYFGNTTSVAGVPTMTQRTSHRTWTGGPFGTGYSNYGYAGTPDYFSMSVVNGNATTPTKVIFNNTRVGYTSNGAVFATGELQLAPFFFNGVPMGGVITLN